MKKIILMLLVAIAIFPSCNFASKKNKAKKIKKELELAEYIEKAR